MWQQSFHPGCQKGILGVYMSSLRDVGNRSDITWGGTFFEPWLKNFDLFLKTAFCVSKGTFLVKNFLKVLFFFKLFGTLNEHLLCLARKFSPGISKLKNAVFVSQDRSKNQTFESSLYLSNSSELWTNLYRAWRKIFEQGYQNWKLYSMSSEYQFEDKNNFLKVLQVVICFGLGTWNFWIFGSRVFTWVVKIALYVSIWNPFEMLVLEVK